LKQEKRVILISTQLIEAGVDIDFPVLYRDFATVASIVQSAGRCNRNGKLGSFGKVKLFRLQRNGQFSSELIYRGRDKELLQLTKGSFVESKYEEKELLKVQKNFFDLIQSDLEWGKHVPPSNSNLQFDFIKDIQECMYEKIGKFQLIDKQLFGEEIQYYVPEKNNDEKFEKLLMSQEQLIELIKQNAERELILSKKKSIKVQLKRMSGQIVQIRLNRNQIRPLQGGEFHYFSLFKIDLGCYSFDKGVDLKGEEIIL